MRILWICNVPLPQIAIHEGLASPVVCGWLSGFANSLTKIKEIELYVAFPVLGKKEILHGNVAGIKYFSFYQPRLLGFLPVENQVKETKLMRKHINSIINAVEPDLLHIFGTEYPHAKVAAELFSNQKKTLVNIQGLTSYYWRHYNLGIPNKVCRKFTFSNLVRGNLLSQADKMKKRGNFEVITLNMVGHVIGRTDWDKACIYEINPQLVYHFCNETLRDCFYYNSWNYDNCEKYSIFISQAATPIKGLHFMLEALPEILRAFPETHLYIAGNDITDSSTVYKKMKVSSYAIYIKKLITRYKLQDKVTFLGTLDAERMKQRFLESHVYVCPSTIENSPNSLGEAMLLGIPCVASDVGGVKDLLTHKKEGYIYQADAPYMLAYYVKQIFAMEKEATILGSSARNHALKTHDPKTNINRLVEIYGEIVNA